MVAFFRCRSSFSKAITESIQAVSTWMKALIKALVIWEEWVGG